MTHYDVLGVPRDATHEDIKQAYRRQVKIYHPDVNPSPDARTMIRQLTEAYDVLSDTYSRNLYDLKLTDPHQYFTYTHPPSQAESDDLRAWRTFRRKKAKEERERIDHLIQIKIRFYRFQRIYSKVFLVLALFFTVDYYYWPESHVAKIISIEGNEDETNVHTSIMSLSTDEELYRLYHQNPIDELEIHYSSIFEIPTRVGIVGEANRPLYRVHKTLHTFHNVFSYIIIAISLIVIIKRQYEEWAMTLAIIPFFLSGFLLLFVVAP